MTTRRDALKSLCATPLLGLPSPEKQSDGWISVEERLPEPDVEVVVKLGHRSNRHNNERLLALAHVTFVTKRWEYSLPNHTWRYYGFYVTHWTPLPELPEHEWRTLGRPTIGSPKTILK